MSNTVHEIEEAMRQFGYKARAVSITRLTELQESVGKLVRQGLVSRQLHERWHFYLKTRENLPQNRDRFVEWLLAAPEEEVVSLREVYMDEPEPARIMESVACASCGESVMESRT